MRRISRLRWFRRGVAKLGAMSICFISSRRLCSGMSVHGGPATLTDDERRTDAGADPAHRFEGDESDFGHGCSRSPRCRLIDDRRAQQRRIATQTLGAASERLVGGDVEADAMAQLGSDWVTAILDSLASDQRDVLLLRVVSDLSIDETANGARQDAWCGQGAAAPSTRIDSPEISASGRIHLEATGGTQVDGLRPHRRIIRRRSFIRFSLMP